uniref:Uncharacterized protein n=1 Tax=Meloidogyne enterolobii TaxID=390850 RepID=A0A6V7TU60_MELEN|nr:unnamed protein product [Meloidogyne enterolobii]
MSKIGGRFESFQRNPFNFYVTVFYSILTYRARLPLNYLIYYLYITYCAFINLLLLSHLNLYTLNTY